MDNLSSGTGDLVEAQSAPDLAGFGKRRAGAHMGGMGGVGGMRTSVGNLASLDDS
jgi:hypothetical protein